MVFGWECRRDGAGVWDVDSAGADGAGIGGSIFTGKGALPTHRCLCVRVEDTDAVAAKAVERGCPILQGPFDLEGVGRLAFLRDPEGHMVGLFGPARTGGEG